MVQCRTDVDRRIGGLEMSFYELKGDNDVDRRIGGLEIFTMRSLNREEC